MGQDDGGSLGDIHAGPTADSDDNVRPELFSRGDAIVEAAQGQFRDGLIVNVYGDPVAFEVIHHGDEVALGTEACVRTNERAGPKRFGGFSKRAALAFTENDVARCSESAEVCHAAFPY